MTHWLCTSCWNEIKMTDVESQNLAGCPVCGGQSIPADLEDLVTFTLPFQLLRILCTWAEFWAQAHRDDKSHMPRVLYEIVDRIQSQMMDHAGSLTLASELAELRGMGYKAELYDAKGNRID